LTATPTAESPAGTVATTVLVAVSITETEPIVPVPELTYARVPAGLTATEYGKLPTATVATTLFVAVSITETLSSPVLTT
jgi:hypothetical protein